MAAPAMSFRVPKLVPPAPLAFVDVRMPAMTAVPPPAAGREILPLASGAPAAGRACSGVVPPMVMLSMASLPATVSVIVTVLESVTATLAAVMFRPGV